jgi:hypothetical protein
MDPEEEAIKAQIYMRMTAGNKQRIPSWDLMLLGYRHGISDATRLNDIMSQVKKSIAA